MSNKIFTLKKQIHNYPTGSVVVATDDEWRIGADWLDTRGSIADGELVALFNYLEHAKLTSILDPMDVTDE